MLLKCRRLSTNCSSSHDYDYTILYGIVRILTGGDITGIGGACNPQGETTPMRNYCVISVWFKGHHHCAPQIFVSSAVLSRDVPLPSLPYARTVNMRHVQTWLQTSSTIKSKNKSWDPQHSNGIKHNTATLCLQHVNTFLGQHLPWDLPTSISQRFYCYTTRLGHFLWRFRCATVSLRSADNTTKAGTSSTASDLYSCIQLQSQLGYQPYWDFMQFSLVTPANNIITP